MNGPLPSTWSGPLMSVLRIVTGLLFMMHGTQKLFAWPGGEGAMPVEMMSIYGVAGVLESVGGALLVLGLFTRPVAFVLAGEMAVTFFMFHIGRSIFPLLNGGEPVVLFCFIFLFLAAAGPGTWALDKPHAGPPRSR
jgi:putative oxidoreductase